MYTDKDYEELDQEEQKLNAELMAALIMLLKDGKDELENEVIHFYTKYGHNGVVSYKDARKRVSLKDKRLRINVLYLTTAKILDATFTILQHKIEDYLTNNIKRELDFFKLDLDPLDFINKPWGDDKLNWSNRLWNMREKWEYTLRDDFLLSVAKGQSFAQLYKQLTKRFASMDKALIRLVEAETTAMRSIVREKAFRELGATKYQYFTQADERTCETCGALHGMIFPMSAFTIGVTAPPIHPHCRDWIVPII